MSGDASPLFDSYVMVDWSAAAQRRTGADSIWWAQVEVRHGRAALVQRSNPATRAAAMVELSDLLAALSQAGQRTLIGFDFPFGYPAGFTSALHLDDTLPPWRAMWQLLGDLIADEDDNRNNRFDVADTLNRLLRFGAFPFWGHPHQHSYDRLGPRRPRRYGPDTLPERRLIEHRVRRAKSVWQLAGVGSVGGQMLVGIPRLLALRSDPRLTERCRIWPFETGLARFQVAVGDIVIAEVYPSLVMEVPEPSLPKDACQVRTLAAYFAELDARGALAPLLAVKGALSAEERDIVVGEEAWILGVLKTAPGRRPVDALAAA